MTVLLEQVYNIIEAGLIAGFLAVYYEQKIKISKISCFCITTILFYVHSNVVTLLNFSWITSSFSIVLLVLLISLFFYEGKLLEHILTSVIITLILSLPSIFVGSFMSKILNTEYAVTVYKRNFSRFLIVMLAQTMRLIMFSIIIALKKKYSFILNKREYLLISSTMIVSIALIIFVRNAIYKTNENYNIFLITVISILLLNVAQFYMLIYISRKNKDTIDISIMKKHIEMQEKSITLLEEKYDETAKIRHDMKNYILNAIVLAENNNKEELINYLKTISDEKIDNIKTYVHTERKVLGAVINSKLSIAQKNGFKMQCSVLSKLDKIADIDVAILLGNLLDNSLEACEKNEIPSEIFLKIWSDAGYYFIEIQNTVDTAVLDENPNLNTNKSDKKLHGIGLKSVKETVKKYNGIINFTQKDNMFIVHISLCK